MNEFKKYLGVIVLLIGVLVLVFSAVQGIKADSDTILATGLALIIIGYIGHIVLNRKYE